MENFINEHFIDPILSHSGYNVINTFTYAIVAIIAVYLLFLIFKKLKIDINKEFMFGAISFVLLGSTVRVVTDSIDTGVFQGFTVFHEFILNSGIYDYGFATSSPGIYIIIASLFLISLFLVNKIGKIEYLKYIGIGLWIPNILLLAPMMSYVLYLIPILILALVPAYLGYLYFKEWGAFAMIYAHGLDGAATFFMIDFFGKLTGIGYWEQHIFSRSIGELFGTFFTFYLVKIGLAVLASYFLYKEKMKEMERNYIVLLIIIIGLAPGIRDVLRMCIGG